MTTVRRQHGASYAQGIKGLAVALKDLDGVQAKSGWFDTEKYPENGTSVAYVAAVQEFGSGPIPPRPFMRPTVAEKKAEWLNKDLPAISKAVLVGKITALQGLEAFSLRVAGQVGDTISKVLSPPLSPITLLAREERRREGRGGTVTGGTIGKFAKQLGSGPANTPNVSTKPLVDTGQLIKGVTGVAERK